MRTGKDRGAYETHHLMRIVCGALPGTACLDEDLRELKLVHQHRRLTGVGRDWRARNGWEPSERTGRGDRNAAQPGRGLALPGRRIRGGHAGYLPDLDRYQLRSALLRCGGDMSGKANRARRKQERLRQRRQQGPVLTGEPRTGEVCPLYRDPPAGEFYGSWVDCGTVRRTIARSGEVMRDRRAADPDVPDLARRMPYLAPVYGRMVPVEAAWQLDRYIDAGSLPVQWAPGGPVTMVPVGQLAPVPDGAPAAETRVAIHDLHARGYLMVADDGTVIPLVPDKPDLAGAGSYDPARYHLAWAPRPEPRARMLKISGARARYGPGYPVTGIIWSQQEFLALPWVRDYLPASGPPGSEQDPRGQICDRYGAKIPADLAVIDMAADDTTVIAVANAGRTYLEPGHLYTFTGLAGLREALYHLDSQGLLLPLSNGLVLAPGLILEPVPAG